MANWIKLLRSATTGDAPGTGDFNLGEIAVNTHDKKLFMRVNNGADGVAVFSADEDLPLPFAACLFDGTAAGFSVIQSFGLDGTTPLTRVSAGLYTYNLETAQADTDWGVVCAALPFTNLQPAPWQLAERGDASSGYLNKTTTSGQLIYGGTSLTDVKRAFFLCYRF